MSIADKLRDNRGKVCRKHGMYKGEVCAKCEPVASPQATEMQTRILDAAYAQQKRMERAAQPATGTTPQAERLIVWCCKGTDGHEDHCIYHSPFPLEARAVAPVETPQFTEIKPVGSHIIDHPDLKRWLEQEPRYAEQRRDGLWIHYTAICTLLKSYAAQKTPAVETRLTAEQFLDEFTDDPRLLHKEYRGKIEKFAEAFRDKSEAPLLERIEQLMDAVSELNSFDVPKALVDERMANAGLREEIERLNKAFDLKQLIAEQYATQVAELRAKLAEQTEGLRLMTEIAGHRQGEWDKAETRAEDAAAKLDQLLIALGCTLGGVESALEVIDAKNVAIETAEAEVASLRERELDDPKTWEGIGDPEQP